MYKQNQGYGICGAKNTYSSKVKLDNWVEDDIGAVLVQNNQNTPHSYDTVQSSSHRPPDKWPTSTHPPLNIPSTQELKTKNKEGMPYSLLFDHGIREVTAEERFTTTSMLTIMKPTPNFKNAYQNNTLNRQKSKQMLQDINLSYVKTTEQQMASAHINFKSSSSIKPCTGTSSNLPNFHRHRPLTSTFPSCNQ